MWQVVRYRSWRSLVCLEESTAEQSPNYCCLKPEQDTRRMYIDNKQQVTWSSTVDFKTMVSIHWPRTSYICIKTLIVWNATSSFFFYSCSNGSLLSNLNIISPGLVALFQIPTNMIKVTGVQKNIFTISKCNRLWKALK